MVYRYIYFFVAFLQFHITFIYNTYKYIQTNKQTQRKQFQLIQEYTNPLKLRYEAFEEICVYFFISNIY